MRKLNNEEFVAELMKFSPKGALGQIFVIEAIRYYSERVVAQGMPDSDPSQFINPKDWYSVACDVKRRLEVNYESDNPTETKKNSQ